MAFKAANERMIELSGTEGVTRLRNAFDDGVIELTDTQVRGYANVPPQIAAALGANDATMARVGGPINRPQAQRAFARPADEAASADLLRRGFERASAAGWHPTPENESSFTGAPGVGGDDARRAQSKGKPRGAAAAGNRARSESAGQRLAAEAASFRQAPEASRRAGQAGGAGPSRLNPSASARATPQTHARDSVYTPPHEEEVIIMDDDGAAEKETRRVREETVRFLAGLYTNMTPSEVRHPQLFHARRRLRLFQQVLFADDSRSRSKLTLLLLAQINIVYSANRFDITATMTTLDAVSRKKLQADIRADEQADDGTASARRRASSADGARVSSPPIPSPGTKRTLSGNQKYTGISRAQRRRSSLSNRRQRARRDHSSSFLVRVVAGTVRLGLGVVASFARSVTKTVADIRYEIGAGDDFFEDAA